MKEEILKIDAQILFLKDSKRQKEIYSKYFPSFDFIGELTMGVIFFEGEPIKRGEKRNVEIEFSYKQLLGNIQVGSKFSFYEGSNIIGTGIVTKKYWEDYEK
tara:strand:+ start:771 stop:1076 length:306 start_codon:yes stop_codon:yes gene_type:complete